MSEYEDYDFVLTSPEERRERWGIDEDDELQILYEIDGQTYNLDDEPEEPAPDDDTFTMITSDHKVRREYALQHGLEILGPAEGPSCLDGDWVIVHPKPSAVEKRDDLTLDEEAGE